MVSRPPKEDLIHIFISNLLPKYKNHVKYLGMKSFAKLYNIGIQIEDD